MSNALRFITAIATIVSGLVVPNETVASGRPPTQPIEIVGMSADEVAATLRDVGLFAEAGLPLPAITITRHDDRVACNGHEGLHQTDGARSVIDICTESSGAWEARTVLHELAHAWAFHFMTKAHMDAFQKVRGWQHWLDYDHAAWGDNGTEQAAEIMVWALSDHPERVVQIDHRSCDELRAGYVALTGLQPLHGYTDYCDGL